MLTGVEAAGLALTSFPIVLNGLSQWLAGVHKIKRWRRIHGQLRQASARRHCGDRRGCHSIAGRPQRRCLEENEIRSPGAATPALAPAPALALEPTPTPSNLPSGPIQDICADVFRIDAAEEKIGYLREDNHSIYRHHVHLIDARVDNSFRITSLDQLLEPVEQNPLQNHLSRRQRLHLAAILASSVLQLDETSWLRSQWKSSDIYFFHKDGDTVLTSNSTLPPPHVAYLLSDSNDEPGDAVKSILPKAQQARSGALLTLGLALVELCFGRTLEKMQMPGDVDDNEYLTRINTAIRNLDEVYDENGRQYGDAVRRCLHCAVDVRKASLDDEAFEQDAFDYVVKPLVEAVEVFNCGR